MFLRLFSLISLSVFIVLMVLGSSPLFAFFRGVSVFAILIIIFQLYIALVKVIGKTRNNVNSTTEKGQQ